MSNSTALVTIDTMPASEARMLHMEVKNRGRGEVKKFINYETAHTPNQYYYRLRKKGVMPLKSAAKNKNSVVPFKSSRNTEVQNLSKKIKQLEMQLSAAMTTPAQRALDVLQISLGEITTTSRKFLCSIISYDRASLSPKQEKWLSDLETKFSSN